MRDAELLATGVDERRTIHVHFCNCSCTQTASKLITALGKIVSRLIKNIKRQATHTLLEL